MKHIALSLLAVPIVFSAVFALAPTVHAQAANQATDEVCEQIKAQDIDARCGDDTIFGDDGLFNKAADILIFLVGAVSVIVLIVAGFMYVISAGNPEQTKRAKDAIMYALIGIAVAFMAFAIVNFVLTQLG